MTITEQGMNQHLVESLSKKWQPILEHADLPEIKGNYRKAVTSVLLENQSNYNKSQGLIQEAVPLNHSAGLGVGTNVASYDPILIGLVRRATPLSIGFDIAGVQPMTAPTGLIFALRARYQEGVDNDLTNEPEALHDTFKTWFSGAGSDGTVGTGVLPDDAETDPSVLNNTPPGAYDTGKTMTTLEGEDSTFNEMGFTIEKVAVSAGTRKLRASLSDELQQDLMAVHGLDAEAEIANILQTEIIMETNRELIRTVYKIAKPGAVDTTTPGIFDLDLDSNGRWQGERFKGLMYQIDREANAVAKETRRGKANILICTSDVASALNMAGDLDFSPAMQENLSVDDTQSTFAGTLRNGMKVFIDPYSTGNWFVVGYKGNSTPYDAGLFYCPYVPLQLYRAVDQTNFAQILGFKSRYGLVTNPFANATGNPGDIVANANRYYRRVKIDNLM